MNPPCVFVPLRACLLALLCASDAAHAGDLHARDPFQALPAALQRAPGAQTPAAPTPADTLELRAIIFDGPRSLADINGRIVGIGATVDGYRVVSIAPRSAVVRLGAQRWTLTLTPKATP